MIAEGSTKLASVPTGGSGGGGGSGGAAASGGAAPEAKEEEKEEEKEVHNPPSQAVLERKFANEFHRSPRRTWVSVSLTKRSQHQNKIKLGVLSFCYKRCKIRLGHTVTSMDLCGTEFRSRE